MSQYVRLEDRIIQDSKDEKEDRRFRVGYILFLLGAIGSILYYSGQEQSKKDAELRERSNFTYFNSEQPSFSVPQDN